MNMATKKVSLRLEEELVAEAREVSGEQGLSSYVNRALAHELQRERIARWLAEAEQVAGPIAPEVLDQVRREWPAPSRNASP